MNEIKIVSCKCKQCKHVKNKRKNRKAKNRMKRWLNKKRRKSDFGTIVYFYWA